MPARTSPRDETPYETGLLPARRALITAAWAAAGGAPADAATALGVARTTLYREIRRCWAGSTAAQIQRDLPGYSGGPALVA